MNAKEHLTACVSEEAIEVALELSKMAHKANRFGLKDRNFLHPDGPDNTERLVDEANDLMGVFRLLVQAGGIPADWQNEEKQQAKMKKVLKCMDYARGTGALQDEAV